MKDKDIKTEDVKIVDDKKYIIKLTKHYSPDNDQTYYFIRLDNLNLYSSADLNKVKERFDHIIKIGLKAYFEEIRIQVTLIREKEVNE